MENTSYKTSLPRAITFAATLIALISSGCTAVLTPIEGIPVSELPEELLGVRRSEFVPVPVVMLKTHPPERYTLDEGDILGIYIDGLLPFSPANTVPAVPPVNFPDVESGMPPSVGFPIPIQEGGLINLPLLRPFSVQGLTVDEVRDEIEARYRQQDFLRNESTVPIVSLMKRREYTVTVIRGNATSQEGSDGRSAGYTLQMPATRNDVLTALMQTGGLPGFNERNEVVIYKTSLIPPERRDEVMAQLLSGSGACCQDGCFDFGTSGIVTPDQDYFRFDDQLLENEFVIRIPLRHPPGQTPQIRPEDVVLENGDIVLVESRETEVFYTGGKMQSGQFPLPRDYDLDVLGAIALAGQGYASEPGRGGVGGIAQGIGGPSPTQLYVIRKLPCGRTFNIAVDLQQAVNNSSQNILVQPGDTLILRYKPHEELVNFGIGTFFTFGIRELFSND